MVNTMELLLKQVYSSLRAYYFVRMDKSSYIGSFPTNLFRSARSVNQTSDIERVHVGFHLCKLTCRWFAKVQTHTGIGLKSQNQNLGLQCVLGCFCCAILCWGLDEIPQLRGKTSNFGAPFHKTKGGRNCVPFLYHFLRSSSPLAATAKFFVLFHMQGVRLDGHSSVYEIHPC